MKKKTMDLLASEGSGACMVHKELGLTRAIIKGTLKSLDHSRRLQMVFANISCGTFFKYYNQEGVRLQTNCPLCPEVCTLSHLQSHISAAFPRTGGEDEMVDYLVCMATVANPGSRLLPLPIQDPVR